MAIAARTIAQIGSARRRVSDGSATPCARWSVLRGSWDRPSLAVGVAEAVADPAHGEEVLRLLGVALELLAQVADVDVDRPRVAVRAVAPDAGEEHVARPHPARVRRERGEDLELDVGRLDLLGAHAHAALGEVDAQLVDADRLLVGHRVAARQAAAAQRVLHAAANLAQPE